MKFDYIKVLDFPKHQKRERILPWIRFGIFNLKDKSQILYPLGLVDSGSDVTFINHEFGKKLGFDIKRGLKSSVYGVGGGKIDVYFHTVGFYIYDGSKDKPFIYQDVAAFTYRDFPATMPQQTAILGTIGFFRNVDVILRYPKRIVVESKDSK